MGGYENYAQPNTFKNYIYAAHIHIYGKVENCEKTQHTFALDEEFFFFSNVRCLESESASSWNADFYIVLVATLPTSAKVFYMQRHNKHILK